MAEPLPGGKKRRRLPRAAYWALGGAVAFIGAAGANLLSQQFPIDQRLFIWVGGSVFIFAGLYILSQGTRSRAAENEDDDDG